MSDTVYFDDAEGVVSWSGNAKGVVAIGERDQGSRDYGPRDHVVTPSQKQIFPNHPPQKTNICQLPQSIQYFPTSPTEVDGG